MKWILIALLVGCAQVTSLNMKKHQFGILPTKIIWLQIAGLEEEQLAMLRFDDAAEAKTAFEDNNCIGKSWNYSLYDLRTSAENGFLSQLTGKKNVTGTCEDTKLRPIWSYIANSGYLAGVMEVGASEKQSLVTLTKCGEDGLTFLSSVQFWLKKEAPKGTQTYAYADPIELKTNQIYYDRSCGSKICTSSIYEDFKAIYSKFSKNSLKNIFILRDFSYLAALEKKDFKRAKEILQDIERVLELANKSADRGSDHLVLMTTSASKYVEFPNQGKEWYEFEKNNKGAEVRKTKLANLVTASGVRAENFCGMYDDSEVMERVLSGPKQQGLELMIINPFKK